MAFLYSKRPKLNDIFIWPYTVTLGDTDRHRRQPQAIKSSLRQSISSPACINSLSNELARWPGRADSPLVCAFSCRQDAQFEHPVKYFFDSKERIMAVIHISSI